MVGKKVREWYRDIRKFWNTIAPDFPSMGPPIRPLPEETEFVEEALKKVEPGVMISLGSTYENVKVGVELGFNVYVPDFSLKMREYLKKMCKSNLDSTLLDNIFTFDRDWESFLEFIKASLKNTNSKLTIESISGKSFEYEPQLCKALTADGSIAFGASDPSSCYMLMGQIRNVIHPKGVVLLRVGVHDPDNYEPTITNPFNLVIRAKEKKKLYFEKNKVQWMIEKEKINREYCYRAYRQPPVFRVLYNLYNRHIDNLVKDNFISKEDGELVKKPLAEYGTKYAVFVPDRWHIEDIFRKTGFKIEKSDDICGCHMISYLLAPV